MGLAEFEGAVGVALDKPEDPNRLQLDMNIYDITIRMTPYAGDWRTIVGALAP